MVIRHVGTEDAILLLWWDKVVAPVINHRPVNGEVMVGVVILNEVLSGGTKLFSSEREGTG